MAVVITGFLILADETLQLAPIKSQAARKSAMTVRYNAVFLLNIRQPPLKFCF
jgi:hypothetical protein